MNTETNQNAPTSDTSNLQYMNIAELRQQAPARLSIREALIILQIGPATFYRLCNEGKIPGVFRIGRRTFIDRDRLLDWLEAEMT